MQLRLVILSVACFACLIPSAVSFNILAAKSIAGQAAADIGMIGANTIAVKKAAGANFVADIATIAAQGVELKSQVLKSAATTTAGALINGAVSIGSTIAKAGLNIIAAKFRGKPTLVYEPSTILYQTPVLQDAIVEETIVQEPVVVQYDQAIQMPIPMAPISKVSMDVRPQFWDIPAPPRLSQAAWTVDAAAPSYEIVGAAKAPCAYEIVQTAQKVGPLVETFQVGKK